MEDLSRPSGISIPLFLKRKWEKQQQQERRAQDPAAISGDNEHQSPDSKDDDTTSNDPTGDNEETSTAIWQPQLRLRPDQELTRDERNELANRVFTTSELEERIWKTTVAMFDIQRQLYRGEEIYYEDTYNHGSIYKGWDAFVDMKDIGTASASGGGATQTSSNRRVPADARWFSTSCGSVSRTNPPTPFPPPLISQSVISAAKLHSIPEQQKAEASEEATPKPLSNPTTSAATKPAPEPTTETNPPSSTRMRQRTAASAASTSSSGTRSAEKADAGVASSTPKARSRPTTPNIDPGTTKKKRKVATTSTGEDPPSKRANQKSSGDEMKLRGPRSATKTSRPTTPTASGTAARGQKSDNDASTTKGGHKSAKSEKKEGASASGTKSSKADTSTPAKRDKDAETPVPRKRGRPRRKT